MAAAKAATSAIGKFSDVANGIEATQELYSEIDSEATVSEEGDRLVREIERVESMAREAGYTEDEIAMIREDLGRPGGFQEKIRGITRAIRTGKRLRSLVSSVSAEKRAQNAQIDTAANTQQTLMAELEQTAATKQLLVEEKKKGIEETLEKKKQIKAIRSSLAKKGARVYGKTGALTFPRKENAFEAAFELGEKFRLPLIGLFVLVIAVRVIFYQFSFKGPESYGDLLRDTLVCAFLLFIFPDLVRAILNLTDGLANVISVTGTEPIRPEQDTPPTLFAISRDWTVLFTWLYEWARFLFYQAASFIVNFGLTFMIVLFPIVIFASQALNFAIAWPTFLGTFIILALWPVFWNATGTLASLLSHRDDATMGSDVSAFLLGLVQFASPLLGAKLLMGDGVMKSVQSAGSAVAAIASSGTSLGGKAVNETFSKDGMIRNLPSNAAKAANNVKAAPGKAMTGMASKGRNLASLGSSFSTSAVTPSEKGSMPRPEVASARLAAGAAMSQMGRAMQFPDRFRNPEKYGKDPITFSSMANGAYEKMSHFGFSDGPINRDWTEDYTA